MMHQLAASLGPFSAVVFGADDKARVPLGGTAAKQTPIFMSLKDKVILPDHDYSVGEGHKLIPSVYIIQGKLGVSHCACFLDGVCL